MLPIPDIHPGCTTDVDVVVDNTRWPFPGPPLDDSKKLQAFSFGLTLPAPLGYVSHTFNGTHLKQILQGDPWYAAVRPVSGGITVAVVLDSQMQNALPEGTSQIVIKIRVRVPLGTPSQQLTLNFSNTLGNPVVPVQFVMPVGAVIPAVQPRTVNVVPGTCMLRPIDGFWPAIVGMPQDAGSSEPLSASSEDSTLPDGESELPPDPSTLEFPEPTQEELEVHYLSDDSGASLEIPQDSAAGTTGLSGVQSASASSGGCSWSSDLGPPPTSEDPTYASYGFIYVDKNAPSPLPPNTYLTIQEGINNARIAVTVDNESQVVIVKGPPFGVNEVEYTESVTVLTNGVGNADKKIIVYAEAGPEKTIITGFADDAPAVTIENTIGESCGSDLTPIDVTFGWTDVDCSDGCLDTDAPSHENWYGFTIRSGGKTSTLLSGGSGVRVELPLSKIEIRGNIVKDNPDPAAAGTHAFGGGIAVIDVNCVDSLGAIQPVEIIMNEITGNSASQMGGGILAVEADCVIAKNWIHLNVGDSLFFPGLSGGGVAWVTDSGETFEDASVALDLCSNRIFSNQGAFGCGVFIDVDGAFPHCIEIFDNIIRLNKFQDSFDGAVGAGMSIHVGSEPAEGLDYEANSLRVLRNQVYSNKTTDSPLISGSVGGVRFDIDMDVFSADPFFVGNMIGDNRGGNVTGGFYLGAWSDIVDDPGTPEVEAPRILKFYHNTIFGNEVVNTAIAARGRELFVPYVDGAEFGYPSFEGKNNIAWSLGIVSDDWYAQCGPTASAVAIDPPFSTADLENRGVTTNCAGAGDVEYDLFGMSGDGDISGNPLVGAASDCHLIDSDSPCIDAGVAISLVTPMDEDVDGESWGLDGDFPDIGADEFFKFKRGDGDGNGDFNALLDAFFSLNYQFGGGPAPPCFDAADADDNETVNLLDALIILSYQFSGGDPPADPGPDSCGLDPTPDGLSCEDPGCDGI